MRRWLFGLALVVSALGGLAACAAREEAKPAPAAPEAAPAARPAWEQEWERVLAAAKQEGKVSVIGPGGPAARQVLTEPFQKKYSITVEFLGGNPRELTARVKSEREANQFLWDIWVLGTTTAITALKPIKAIDPIEPALILPEVKELKNWRGGALEFSEKDRLNLVMTPFQRGTLFVNPNNVDPKSITSYKDLLEPKWKGKIVMDDPRTPGPGQATFTLFYRHPALGPGFIRALAKQEPDIAKDYRQEAEWVIQGRYLASLGTADFFVEPFIKQGLPITIVDPRQLKEGTDVSPANGTLVLMNRAPHPNAAKVFINWLLTKEGQTDFVRATGYVSNRLDVPTDHALPWRVPMPGAIKTYDEEAMAVKGPLVSLLREVFGR